MKYLSIDIETTGLDPQKCQIIEFAAVYDDLMDPRPVEDLPYLQLGIPWNAAHWERKALEMNRELAELVNGDYPSYRKFVSKLPQVSRTSALGHLRGDIKEFLWHFGLDNGSRLTVAGKNVEGFDLRFLEPLTGRFWHRRVLDVGPLFLRPDDDVVPSLSECMRRAGIQHEAEHRALGDARDVVRLIRHHFRNGRMWKVDEVGP